MDIDRFKSQHDDILRRIDSLRSLAHGGVSKNSQRIAQEVQGLGKVVTLHLAIEDRILYPAARAAENPQISEMGERYQQEMKGIANPYVRFTNKWSDAARLMAEPELFRQEANSVLKAVYLRMQRENHEFYPAIEHM